MEHQRTITKLRSLKIGIVLYLLIFLYGIIISLVLELKQESVVLGMRNETTHVLDEKYNNDMSYAIKVCAEAFDYLEKSGELAMLYSLIGLVFALYYIRLDMHTRAKVLTLLLFGLGAGVIVLFYLSVGLLLPKSASVLAVKNSLKWLYFPGFIMMVLGGGLFVYHTFKRIVVQE